MAEQTSPGTDGPDDVEAPAGVDEARGWIGAKLDEMGGTTAGRVEGLLVDAVDGSPAWVLARLSRFGKHVAVPFEFVAAGVGHLWVPYPRETIRAASEVESAGGLSCGDERSLAAIFGIPEGTGRLAAIDGRGDEEPGSVPAG